MKTDEKTEYELFPEISGSRNRLIVSAARILISRPSKDSNNIDFIPTIFEDKNRRVRVPVVGSMKAERRAKERNHARKVMMCSQLRTIRLAVLGKRVNNRG